MFSMQYFSGMWLRTIAACATIALLETSPSRAMSLVDGDHDMCRTSTDWDARIEACTRIILEGDNSPYRLSSVYTGRAFGYLNKGNFDRSIEDCNEGIRLGPYQPYAYEARGAVYFARGDFASAIADFDKAIEKSPREGRAYFGGGIAHFYAGNWTKALAYLDRAHELSPLYSMYALWRDIVAVRSSASSVLTSDPDRGWPWPIIQMFLGQMTPDEVRATLNIPGATDIDERTCDANFYIGELMLRRGDTKEAARLYRLAADGCKPSHNSSGPFIEREAAKLELRALDGGSDRNNKDDWPPARTR
jgi:tetratricopeptide (TPR) repeat protein